MKRLDLVQLTIVIVAIISTYFGLQLIPQFLFYVFTWFSEGLSGGYYMQLFIGTIINLSVYLIVIIYGIRQSKQLAGFICNKANINGEINLSLNKFDLLYAVFIALGIAGLIKQLPGLLKDIVVYTKSSNDSLLSVYEGPRIVKKSDLAEESISVALYFILLVYAKTFSEFLSARIKNTEPEDEINNDKGE